MSSQLTADALDPEPDRHTVEHPEAVWFTDYHEHLRKMREEAAR